MSCFVQSKDVRHIKTTWTSESNTSKLKWVLSHHFSSYFFAFLSRHLITTAWRCKHTDCVQQDDSYWFAIKNKFATLECVFIYAYEIAYANMVSGHPTCTNSYLGPVSKKGWETLVWGIKEKNTKHGLLRDPLRWWVLRLQM